MVQTFAWVVLFLLLLISLPFGIKWIQRRGLAGSMGSAASSRVVTAVAVGPHQRVVTVEVGPEGCKTWLVLGVTAQSITCLHAMPAETSSTRPSGPTVLV
jgi:flagellar protein FliO/FliZ